MNATFPPPCLRTEQKPSGVTSRTLVGSGKHYRRKIKRAQILLTAADSRLSDEDIAAAVAVGGSTVYRTSAASLKVISKPP